jgi:hypothetical protein
VSVRFDDIGGIDDHQLFKLSFHVVIINNAWYNTMKIWKEVFHSFSKEIVLHLNQISGGLGS